MYSDAGIHDRVVIQELLKETAQSQSLESVQKDFKGRASVRAHTHTHTHTHTAGTHMLIFPLTLGYLA